MIYTVYAEKDDMTFIMQQNDQEIKVTGFYFGPPNEQDTETYKNDLKATIKEKQEKYILWKDTNGESIKREFPDYDSAFKTMHNEQDKTLKKLGVIVPYIRNDKGEVKTNKGKWVKVELYMYKAVIECEEFKQYFDIDFMIGYKDK